MEKDRFTDVYNLHFKLVRDVAAGIIRDGDAAEDIAQGIFLKILTKGDYEDIREMKFYLYTIARRQALNYLRDRDRRILKQTEAQMRLLENSTQHLPMDELRIAISSLPKQQKRVFVLGRLSGWSSEEIGEALHIARYTVFNHLKNAQKSLKQTLRA